MKKWLIGFWFSLPVQLLFLHFKRHQILLIFWYILFATVGGRFMKSYGANYLFLAPEYFDKVSYISTAFVGFAVGIFIMSWNITTFILHTRYIKFLATTAQPFLKYCTNNAVIPILFLGYYFGSGIHHAINKELLQTEQIVFLSLGFIGGLLVSLIIAVSYFFSADKTIYYTYGKVIKSANEQYAQQLQTYETQNISSDRFRIDWFFSAKLALRKPREVRHYSKEFLEAIFKRHHFAAAAAIFLAFVALIVIGFISDSKLFQFPAAASVVVLFAVLIAGVGAFSIFFGNKSLIAMLLTYLLVNYLYQQNIIDPRNKLYGLSYTTSQQPKYNEISLQQLASPQNIAIDKAHYLQILNNWKAKQKNPTPVLYIINVSGGGLRSAYFTINVLQQLNRLSGNELLHKTLFISGASGGMLGATYFRELYWQQQQGKLINPSEKFYAENISKDLLNPIFSSIVSRDIMGPIQKFTYSNEQYVKDRGYAFEQKLNANTKGLLNKQLKDYLLPEKNAQIPFMFFNGVITQDARKLIIASHPARFLMQIPSNISNNKVDLINAVDYTSFFSNQQSENTSILSALRMNATFPYALPNVALPTQPIIDVMDGGLRDNYGQETTLAFLQEFKDWLQQNTSKVVLLQIRDRNLNNWDIEVEEKQYINFLTQPFLVLQNNWYRLQDYHQADALDFFANGYGNNFTKLSWQYIPAQQNQTASLSFHLTPSEKNDIKNAIDNKNNQDAFDRFLQINKN